MARSNTYAVIIAGGSGTRFWPRSRRGAPKQLLPIVSERSLLQETVDRVRSAVPSDRILIVTTKALKRAVRRQLPELPERNVIGEPAGRNTAACIGLAAVYIERNDPNAVMTVLPADHLIADRKAFRRSLGVAADLAADDHLVAIGITPTHAETGYGYIEWGEAIRGTSKQAAWAKSFTEKPDRRRAQRFLSTGRYLWNSGMFAWTTRRILGEIQTHLPKLARGLESLRPALGTKREGAVLNRVYPRLPAISVDYGILERVDRVAVVRGKFGWSDVGSWAAMEGLWRKDRNGRNAVRGRAVAVDSEGCIVDASDRLVALCGVRDLVIVDSPDALLVCPKGRAQDIRAIVRELERRGLTAFL